MSANGLVPSYIPLYLGEVMNKVFASSPHYPGYFSGIGSHFAYSMSLAGAPTSASGPLSLAPGWTSEWLSTVMTSRKNGTFELTSDAVFPFHLPDNYVSGQDLTVVIYWQFTDLPSINFTPAGPLPTSTLQVKAYKSAAMNQAIAQGVSPTYVMSPDLGDGVQYSAGVSAVDFDSPDITEGSFQNLTNTTHTISGVRSFNGSGQSSSSVTSITLEPGDHIYIQVRNVMSQIIPADYIEQVITTSIAAIQIS